MKNRSRRNSSCESVDDFSQDSHGSTVGQSDLGGSTRPDTIVAMQRAHLIVLKTERLQRSNLRLTLDIETALKTYGPIINGRAGEFLSVDSDPGRMPIRIMILKLIGTLRRSLDR